MKGFEKDKVERKDRESLESLISRFNKKASKRLEDAKPTRVYIKDSEKRKIKRKEIECAKKLRKKNKKRDQQKINARKRRG